jgi:hypothetical protein
MGTGVEPLAGKEEVSDCCPPVFLLHRSNIFGECHIFSESCGHSFAFGGFSPDIFPQSAVDVGKVLSGRDFPFSTGPTIFYILSIKGLKGRW